jgi:hypothetical protein
MVKNLNDITYYPSFKITHNLRDMKILILKNWKYFSNFKIFKTPLPHVNGL